MSYQAIVYQAEHPEAALRADPPVAIEVPPLHNIEFITPCSLHAIDENHKGYQIEVVNLERKKKQALIRINGTSYVVALKDALDRLIEKMGIATEIKGKGNTTLLAPMPGLILHLKVKAGDLVEAGSPLLVLEAMKMENTLLAPSSGLIKTIAVSLGSSVEKGQLLAEIVPAHP